MQPLDPLFVLRSSVEAAVCLGSSLWLLNYLCYGRANYTHAFAVELTSAAHLPITQLLERRWQERQLPVQCVYVNYVRLDLDQAKEVYYAVSAPTSQLANCKNRSRGVSLSSMDFFSHSFCI
jgi:hypothetical protein